MRQRFHLVAARWQHLFVIVGLALLALTLPSDSTTAQESSSANSECSVLSQRILEAVSETCSTLGRDEICYGSIQVDAEPVSNVADFTFEQEGDIAEVASLATLRLQSLDPNSAEWGVALVKVQASLPDDAPQDVSLLLFGDVQVQNTGSDIPRVTLTTNTAAAVRLGASSSTPSLGTLARGAEVQATGRFIDQTEATWIRVDYQSPQTNVGWVSAALFDGDASSLRVVDDSDEPVFGPMQAFTFQTGQSGTDACGDDVSSSGLLIQTPAGVGEISFFINEVDIQIGSTALLQAEPNADMRVTTFEGSVDVAAQGVRRSVPPGARSRIPLDADGLASDAPEQPEPVPAEADAFAAYGEVGIFADTFSVPDAFSEECLNDYNAEFNADPDDDSIFGDEIGNGCLLRYLAAFNTGYRQNLPFGCYADDSNVRDDCLREFNRLVSPACFTEQGDLTPYCLNAAAYLDYLLPACYAEDGLRDECIAAFQALDALPDECFADNGVIIDECLGASGMFYQLPGTCYSGENEIFAGCLATFGALDDLYDFDDSCVNATTGAIDDECLDDEAFRETLPEACFDAETDAVLPDCLDGFAELEAAPDECFSDAGNLLEDCYGAIIADDGSIYGEEIYGAVLPADDTNTNTGSTNTGGASGGNSGSNGGSAGGTSGGTSGGDAGEDSDGD